MIYIEKTDMMKQFELGIDFFVKLPINNSYQNFLTNHEV